MRFSLTIFLVLFFISFSHTQNYPGTYQAIVDGNPITMVLNDNGQGGINGQLTGAGFNYHLQGIITNGILEVKALSDYSGFYLQAELKGKQLHANLWELNVYGQPIAETMQSLIFKRIDSEKPGDSGKKTRVEQEVRINDIILSTKQIAEMEKTYGQKPMPGNYWYDSRSGLYGVVGYAAYGFMLPGHEYGALSRKASNGNTNVLVNGRELTQNEWAVWSYILGYWIQPGAYWLDSNGNAGYEGNPVPTVNLYTAAQQNAYQGKGSGGDNFWSTRFSAGNSDSGGSRGYVSVPGYGPVGYGF